MREDKFRSDIDICILSAEYGLIDATTEIGWYDRRMDTQRAEKLAAEVAVELQDRLDGTYDKVIVNVGKTYKRAIEDGLSTLDVEVQYIEGDGIGVKGSRLKQIIRSDGKVALV